MNGDYLADTEAATPRAADPLADGPRAPWSRSTRPGAATIELVASHLGIDASRTLKNIMFDIDGQTVAVLVPGDREVSEKKLSRLHFPKVVRPFDDGDFERGGYAKGYVGPQGSATTSWSSRITPCEAARTGSPERIGRHATSPGANLDRDFRVDRWEDLVEIREGDRCPIDGGELEVGRSIVVGSHLPTLDEVLRAARGHVPGRGRVRAGRT